MDEPARAEVAIKAFLFQIREQCHHALIARWLMDDPVQEMTWFGISAFLSATANLSKCFWGEKGKYEKERAPLRDRVGVPNDSPLRITNMRNHFEHFDSRIDKWAGSDDPRNYADLNIGARVEGITSGDEFRAYDPGTHVVDFLG